MAQSVKAPAAKSDNLGSNPETHMVEGENRPQQDVPMTSICTWHCVHIHTNTQNKVCTCICVHVHVDGLATSRAEQL